MGPRKCIVPTCTNTSENAPGKAFVCVPKDENTRNQWFNIIGKKASRTGFIHCCEDHFDLPNDSLNYIRQKYMGGPVKLKPGIVPHKNLKPKICRICLTKLFDDDEPIYVNEATEETKQLLETYLAEIDFSLTTNPEICGRCFRKIETFHNMKIKALSQEVHLVSHMKQEIKNLKDNDKLREDYKINLLTCYKEIKDACNRPIKLGKKRKGSTDKHGDSGKETEVITSELDLREDKEFKIEENVVTDQNGYKELKENKETKKEASFTCNVQTRPLRDTQNWISEFDNTENNSDEITQSEQESSESQLLLRAQTQQQPVLVNSEMLNITNNDSHTMNNKKIIYNNEVCQVVYLNEDGTGSYTTVNVIQLFDHNNSEESTCLFCDSYFGDDILNHSFMHCGSIIKCNLCDFFVEVATENIITEHIYVHSVVSNDNNDSQK